MDKTVKTFIIIVIILVAILGVVGGVFLQGYLSNNKNVTVVNQTNVTINQSSSVNQNSDGKLNNNTQTTSDSSIISSQKSIEVAKECTRDSYARNNYIYKAQLIESLNPYYKVSIYVFQGGSAIAWIDVDAKTGQYICSGHNN